LKLPSNIGHTKSANLVKRKNYQKKLIFHQVTENESSPKSFRGQEFIINEASNDNERKRSSKQCSKKPFS
jgi:hypothetical protein